MDADQHQLSPEVKHEVDIKKEEDEESPAADIYQPQSYPYVEDTDMIQKEQDRSTPMDIDQSQADPAIKDAAGTKKEQDQESPGPAVDIYQSHPHPAIKDTDTVQKEQDDGSNPMDIDQPMSNTTTKDVDGINMEPDNDILTTHPISVVQDQATENLQSSPIVVKEPSSETVAIEGTLEPRFSPELVAVKDEYPSPADSPKLRDVPEPQRSSSPAVAECCPVTNNADHVEPMQDEEIVSPSATSSLPWEAPNETSHEPLQSFSPNAKNMDTIKQEQYDLLPIAFTLSDTEDNFPQDSTLEGDNGVKKEEEEIPASLTAAALITLAADGSSTVESLDPVLAREGVESAAPLEVTATRSVTPGAGSKFEAPDHLVTKEELDTVKREDAEPSDPLGATASTSSPTDINSNLENLSHEIANEKKNTTKEKDNELSTLLTVTAARSPSLGTSSKFESRAHLLAKEEEDIVMKEEESEPPNSPPVPQPTLSPSQNSFETALSHCSSQIRVEENETNDEKTMKFTLPNSNGERRIQDVKGESIAPAIVVNEADEAQVTELAVEADATETLATEVTGTKGLQIEKRQIHERTLELSGVEASANKALKVIATENTPSPHFLASVEASTNKVPAVKAIDTPQSSKNHAPETIDTVQLPQLSSLVKGHIQQPDHISHSVMKPDTSEMEKPRQPEARDVVATTACGVPLEVCEAYNNFFLIMHNLPANIDATNIDNTIRQTDLLFHTANLYDCTHIVRPHITHHLLSFGRELFQAICEDPPYWLSIGLDLECPPIFKEAVVHIVGQAPKWQSQTSYFERRIQDLIELKVSELLALKNTVNEELYKSNINVDGQDLTLFNMDKTTYDSWHVVQVWQ
jgi:hypothetical protein